MKKLLSIVIFMFLFMPTGICKSYKLITQVVEPFSTENPKKNFKVIVYKNYFFENGETLEKGCIINTNVTKVVKAKRGKLNAYFYVQLKDFTIPSIEKIISVENKNAIAKITPYKELDVTDTAIDAGTSVAGFFVKNVSYPVNFIRGIVKPNEGENRLKSGVKTMYKKSALAYIEQGEEMNLEKDDLVIMNIKYKANDENESDNEQ